MKKFVEVDFGRSAGQHCVLFAKEQEIYRADECLGFQDVLPAKPL
jgi:hypothetical protein